MWKLVYKITINYYLMCVDKYFEWYIIKKQYSQFSRNMIS